jgi:hypothetical protein
MYVNANFFTNAGKVANGIRYISHREEQLPAGTTRPLYGLGTRYRELQGDEAAIVQRLRSDGAGLKEPHFYRIKLTVDDALAQRVMALPAKHREWAVRDAVERTFRGALSDAQGAFVVHYHGGTNRPFGHPHAHVHLSPRLQDGSAFSYIPRATLGRFKERWEHEVELAVARHERRVPRSRTLGRSRHRLPTLSEALSQAVARGAMGRPAARVVRLQAAARQLARTPSRIGAQLGLAVFNAIAPAPLRAAVRITRTFGFFSSED